MHPGLDVCPYVCPFVPSLSVILGIANPTMDVPPEALLDLWMEAGFGLEFVNWNIFKVFEILLSVIFVNERNPQIHRDHR